MPLPAFFPLELNSVLFPTPGETAWGVEGVRKRLTEIIAFKESYDSHCNHRLLQGCTGPLPALFHSSVMGSLDRTFPKGEQRSEKT